MQAETVRFKFGLIAGNAGLHRVLQCMPEIRGRIDAVPKARNTLAMLCIWADDDEWSYTNVLQIAATEACQCQRSIVEGTGEAVEKARFSTNRDRRYPRPYTILAATSWGEAPERELHRRSIERELANVVVKSDRHSRNGASDRAVGLLAVLCPSRAIHPIPTPQPDGAEAGQGLRRHSTKARGPCRPNSCQPTRSKQGKERNMTSDRKPQVKGRREPTEPLSIGRSPRRQDIRELVAFLPKLYGKEVQPPIVQWIGSGENGDDDLSAFPWPDYNETVNEFINLIVAQDCWTDGNYEPVEAVELIKDEAAVSKATIPEVQRMLTAVVRGERFCGGWWGSMIEDGHVRRLLERLAEIEREDLTDCPTAVD